jgi:DNA-binding Xre family transcriptional regulator
MTSYIENSLWLWKRGICVRKASYKKLWKLLIDKDMNKKTLAESAHISMSSLSKLAKGETVNVEILIKICNALDCTMNDIMELIQSETNDAVGGKHEL